MLEGEIIATERGNEKGLSGIYILVWVPNKSYAQIKKGGENEKDDVVKKRMAEFEKIHHGPIRFEQIKKEK